MAHEGWHEDESKLSEKTKDLHRAILSLMEELEAVDWYQQRVDAATDPDLKTVLAHNRDEEKEHAAMAIEWLRRNDEGFAKELKDWLFTTKPFTKENDAAHQGAAAPAIAPVEGRVPLKFTVASLRGQPPPGRE
jgi:uncharacterized protein